MLIIERATGVQTVWRFTNMLIIIIIVTIIIIILVDIDLRYFVCVGVIRLAYKQPGIAYCRSTLSITHRFFVTYRITHLFTCIGFVSGIVFAACA